MIESKFTARKTFGQFPLIGLLIFLLALFYGIFLRNAHSTPLFSNDGISVVLLTVATPAWITWMISLKFRSVIIDTDNETISFRSYFFRRITTYDLKYFDCYADTIAFGQAGFHKTLYLIKNGRVIYKLSALWYKNLDELQEGLSSLKYMGFIKYTTALSLKIGFGKQII